MRAKNADSVEAGEVQVVGSAVLPSISSILQETAICMIISL